MTESSYRSPPPHTHTSEYILRVEGGFHVQCRGNVLLWPKSDESQKKPGPLLLVYFMACLLLLRTITCYPMCVPIPPTKVSFPGLYFLNASKVIKAASIGTEVEWYFCQARFIGSTLGCPCKNSPLGSEPVTALSSCRIWTVWMIIVPHLRWRTFRYWAIRASDVRGTGLSLGTLGNSSTDFDLKTHVYPQRSPCKPASTLLPVASSLQHPCSNNVWRLFLYHLQQTKKSKRVACCHQTFNVYKRNNF